MPNINLDDAYILDETGAQVDQVTGLYLKNENASDTEKAQARANIGAGGSNRNLLDNAYFVGGGSQLGDGVFPINQRGQTQYTGGGTQLDRWHGWAGTDTLVLTANGLQYTSPSSNGIFQYFPVFPTTQTVTFSVKVNGTITSITLAEGTIHAEEDFSGYKLTVDRNDKCVGIFSLNETILLQAAKLEVGTVSTLANDAPPDYGAALAKCQRRLFRVSPMGTSQRGYAGFGSANSSKNILVFVPTPATLAAQPTVSFSNCNAYNYVTGGSIAISSISIDSWTQNGVFLSCTPSDASQVVQYQPYVLRVAQGGYLQIACEL